MAETPVSGACTMAFDKNVPSFSEDLEITQQQSPVVDTHKEIQSSHILLRCTALSQSVFKKLETN